MKICCYTCITGNYDRLKDPEVVPENIDFICFTDNRMLRSKVWQIRPIPEDLQYLSDVKTQRTIKLCPHRYLSDYDLSIWVDGNIEIIGDLNEFLGQYDLNSAELFTRIHPSRKCVYEEAKKILAIGKDLPENILYIVDRYRNEGFPENIGMAETCILVRRHNERTCRLFSNAWVTELLLNSHRDQMSFNYIAWKMRFQIGYLTKDFNLKTDKYFRWRMHG